MTISVDPIASPRIITIPEADGDSITIQSLVNQIREWEQTVLNLSYKKLLTAAGKDDLGGGTFVGITARLENAKLKFEGRVSPTLCVVSGGNVVAVDEAGDPILVIEPSANVTVEIAQSSSATIKNIDEIDFVYQKERGRWKIDEVAKTLTYYDEDGVTPIQVFDLKDADGNPTSENPYERVPQ